MAIHKHLYYQNLVISITNLTSDSYIKFLSQSAVVATFFQRVKYNDTLRENSSLYVTTKIITNFKCIGDIDRSIELDSNK